MTVLGYLRCGRVATFSDFCQWVAKQPYKNYIVMETDFRFITERVGVSGILPRDAQGRSYIEFGEHRVTLVTPHPDLGPELDLVAAGRSILGEIDDIERE